MGFTVPPTWRNVMIGDPRNAERMIGKVFGDYDQIRTCAGPIAADDGAIWKCEWCGAQFTQPYGGMHARKLPAFLSDFSAAFSLVDNMRRRDTTLQLEIGMMPGESINVWHKAATTRLYVERAVAPAKAAHLTRFVSGDEYAHPKRTPLNLVLFEALLELYEYQYTEGNDDDTERYT